MTIDREIATRLEIPPPVIECVREEKRESKGKKRPSEDKTNSRLWKSWLSKIKLLVLNLRKYESINGSRDDKL